MSDTIKIEIKSNSEQIAAAVARFPETAGKAVAGAMDDVNKLTVGVITDKYLTVRGGLHSVGVVSNKLRQTTLATPATVLSGLNVRSGIGSNAVSKSGISYPRVHEFGYSGTVNVPGFTRRNPPKRGPRGGKGKKGNNGTTTVRAHTMRLNFRERAMFRTGINDQIPDYLEAFTKAIRGQWGELGQ